MSAALYVFDDHVTRSWDPLHLTRPGGELLFGALLLRERAEDYWKVKCRGHVSSESLSGFSEPGSPPVVGPSGISSDSPRLFQVARAALAGLPPDLPGEKATLFLEGNVVGWFLPAGASSPPPHAFLSPEPLEGSLRLEVSGRLLREPWNLMAENPEQLREDIPRLFPGYAADDLPGCHILGNGLVSLGTDVEVEPGSVFDVRKGPIRLSDGVVVRTQTRLEGPAFVGPGTTLLGGALSEVSLGPACKIRGEVESTVVLGFTNKAHDGFLGHSYLGRWINLGAMTTNSDLKNNYGPVRVGGFDGPRDTGLRKVGCLLGDHVKTGIGTMLNTGTVVGTGSNIFGGRMPPTYVPPFSWGSGQELSEYKLEKFLEVAETVMGRRGMELDAGTESVLRLAWEAAGNRRLPRG